ncbi:protein kinase [Sorangium sp. So ce119]|uniref:serine/threonine-protein kinase n=1 Tax=Sorangium sp. So ce119 TaxID=3133279 RepID=UPI003F60EADC
MNTHPVRPETVFAGRYLLERRAGAGGMGEVWKALDQETGEAAAVKVLPGSDPKDVARFEREAQILAGLAHAHVVRYVAHGASAEGKPYLVMEWLEGEDLAARLSRGPLAVGESVALALRVAEVLAFAHEQGVIHRDLKPSNMFLPGGRLDAVKVLDFGIARVRHATRMTRTGALIGTPGYMAPEQARGEANVDARTDVFSLGCVLFECLTGEAAFGGQHMVAALTKVLFEETPSARSVRPEVPEALDRLLRKMLSKEREERPLDGRAAAEALRALKDLPSNGPGASSRAPSLTASEQRAVAVILVSAPGDAEVKAFDGSSTLVVTPVGSAILREAAEHGGRVEMLLDGSVAVMLAGAGLAKDLCAQAAHCALSLRAHAEGRRVALAMGRGERTARSMGPVIDRVARLSDTTARRAAPEGAVMIDDVAAGLLDARFEVREEEGFFALHGERALADGARLLLGKATPCVGRDRELGMLRALFTESAEEGTAQATMVVAPPGVGKSRLAQEFLQELRARGEAVSIWIARADGLRAGSPLGMLGQLVRSACGIREGEPLGVRRDKLSMQVAVWVAPGEQRRVAAFLGEIIGAPFPDEDNLPLEAARLDARLMADQVHTAFLDFVRAACERAPVLVLLEDLHWGDKITVQLLDAALRALEERPLFILALARPEVHEVFPKLWTERRSHEVRLNELSRRAGERLARHVLGARADAAMVERIVRLSEGNAFYLEELIRWTAEGNGSDMPETVVAMVESRLLGLDEEARRLLRAASVFGEVCCKRETIRRRRNNPEWFRNVGCCARRLRGKRGEAGGTVRGHGRAPVPVLAVAGRQGRGFGSLRLGHALGAVVVHHPAARQGGTRRGRHRAHGAGADRHGPSPRREGRSGRHSTPSRRQGRRARSRGRRSRPRHARGRRGCRSGRRPPRLLPCVRNSVRKTGRRRAVAGSRSDFVVSACFTAEGGSGVGQRAPSAVASPRLRDGGITDRGRRLARPRSTEAFSFARRPVAGPFDALPPVSGSCLRPRTLLAQRSDEPRREAPSDPSDRRAVLGMQCDPCGVHDQPCAGSTSRLQVRRTSASRTEAGEHSDSEGNGGPEDGASRTPMEFKSAVATLPAHDSAPFQLPLRPSRNLLRPRVPTSRRS